MDRHRMAGPAAGVIALLAAVTAAPAQQLRDVRTSGGYGAFGVGAGSLTLECDSGCPGGSLSANDLVFLFGRQFGSRLRAELGGRMQRSTGDYATSATTGQVGLAAYLVGNLYVRGAATYLSVEGEDSAGTTTGTGGPGFTIGAGYEVFVGSNIALTAYANYHAASVSALDRTIAAGTARTAGTLSGLSFGVSIGKSPRRPQCYDADGRRAGLMTCVEADRARIAGTAGTLHLELIGLSFSAPAGDVAWRATTATTGSGRLDQLVGTGRGGQLAIINVTHAEGQTCTQFMADLLLRTGSRLANSPTYMPTGGWFTVVIEQETNSAFLCLPLASGILVTGAVTPNIATRGLVTVRPALFALGQAAQRRWGRAAN